MLVIFPFCAADKPQALRLAEWISELAESEGRGEIAKHDCLLAVHKDTDSVGVIEPLKQAFGRVAEFSITDDMIVEREQHAYAANLMWKRTVNHVADMNESADFLWLEPDAVPLSVLWRSRIASAHAKSGKAFLHDLVETPRGKSNSGCGVYPAKVRDYTDRLWELSNVSWDVLLTPDFAPHTAYTPLIQDIGFMPGTQVLPTFPDAASLSIIRPEAVLFHRSKDGTLIQRLREQKGGGQSCERKTPSVSIENAESPTSDPAALLAAALARIHELEAKYAERPNPKAQPVKIRAKKKPKRTPAEQAAIDARMAKARAARKLQPS